jgi:hypothetical protein
MLPSYVEVQARVMACMVSPPNIRKNVRYDLSVRFLIDDVALE